MELSHKFQALGMFTGGFGHLEWGSGFHDSDTRTDWICPSTWLLVLRFSLNNERNTHSEPMRVEHTRNQGAEAIYCDRWLYTDPGFIIPYYISQSLFLKISLIFV